MKVTYYIVPALTDQAGQCRIVSREGSTGDVPNNYRHHPDKWQEAGLMNSQGRLVCLEGTARAVAEFRDCEPLAAGLVITVDNPSWDDLTEAQGVALREFKSRLGIRWKEALLNHWSAGTDTDLICGHLFRQIRNRLGPEWLNELPEN